MKRGREDEFVRVWRELARHAVAEFGAASPTFLRDREDTSLFVTFGVWDGLDALQRFRASPLAAERGRVLGDLIEEGQARILEEVGVDD